MTLVCSECGSEVSKCGKCCEYLSQYYCAINFFVQEEEPAVKTSQDFWVLHSDVQLNRQYRRNEIPVFPQGDYSTAYGAVLDIETITTQINNATKV